MESTTQADQIYTDLAYGSLFQKRNGKTWYARYSFRCPAFTKGKGLDGDKWGDWVKVGESIGPERALQRGKLVPYNPGSAS